ncbi:oxidoreductase [Stappia sp.]|uniref:oxidoreductase n=1 Tax=Stappia sp. TaxID=1870903 RepID=UPI0025CB7AD1|nr:oxidoreductase [Stappia sp.]
MRFRELILGLAAVLLAVLPHPALASKLPAETVVLTVDGAIDGDAPRDFTIADLEALGLVELRTTTPWHDNEMLFEGVPMARLMEAVGARGDTVVGAALNNYLIDIPIADFETFGVLLAFKANGEYMGVRDKGPLFVIYPFDRFPDIRNELYYSRSIWQLRRLTVK